MNKIYLAAAISVIAAILSTVGYVSLEDNMVELTPNHPPFGTLTCDQIVNQNHIGIVINTDDPTFTQERVIECLREHRIALELMDYRGSQLECMDRDDVWANDQCYPKPKTTTLGNGCVSNDHGDGSYTVECDRIN